MSASAKTFTAPNIIHFVWVGGTIPQEYFLKVERLAVLIANANFKIHVWVDDSKHFSKAAEIRRKHLEIDQPLVNLHVCNIFDLTIEMRKHSFYQQGARFRKFWEFVNRERVGFKNLAAAKDFLAIEILRQYGGIYIDIDTDFNFATIDQLQSNSLLHGIQLNMVPMLERAQQSGDIIINAVSGNNDVLIAIANHPILFDVIDNMIEMYEKYDTTHITKKVPVAYPTSAYTTMMDVKRFPADEFYAGQFFKSMPKVQLTLQAGPNVLSACFLKYWRELPHPSIHDVINITLYDFLTKKYKVANVEIYLRSDKTWLKVAKKSLCFDDLELNLRTNKF